MLTRLFYEVYPDDNFYNFFLTLFYQSDQIPENLNRILINFKIILALVLLNLWA